ncbi:MAG TPA: DUF3300 domain-containing protein [Burkholderiaceae bacterium]|nr:DUF3300 domain-containing protein [Burkholderiaceae bacterium]
MTTWQSFRVAVVMAIATPLAFGQAPATPAAPAKPPPIAAAPAGAPASKEQLEQLLAPIALYPDSLLSQVLMAATYPSDVADAAKWAKAHPDQKGDAAVKAVQDQPWDPSVQSLAAFPQVLDMMGAQPDWVQKLGDAFLASSKDVLDAVQRLRQKAQQAGNLKTTEQQKVIVEQEPQTQQTVVKIEPAQPETVYVPAYNPTVVYGTWPYPAYPPYYYPPPPYYYPGGALAAGIAFGIGVAAIGSLWGGCNWGGGNVNINVNKYNNVNVNRKLDASQNNFQHNSANRRGVPYADQASRDKFGSKGPGDASARNDYRGRDPSRDAQRQQAQSSLQDRGMSPQQGREQLRTDQATRDRANQATQGAGRDAGGFGGADRASVQNQARGASDSALRGASNPAQSRQQIDRGNASRQSSAASRGGGGGGGRAGGGGGGRRR